MNHTDIAAEFKRAFDLHQKDRLAEAGNIYRQILQLQPDHSDCLHLLGLVAHKSGDNRQAIELIQKAIETYPNSPTFYMNLGVIFKDEGRAGDAISCFQKAIQFKPDMAEAYSNMGNALLIENRPEQALSCFQKAIELNPKLPETYTNMGNALIDLGRHEEAITWFEKTIAINPNAALAYYNKGNALQNSGRLDESIQNYEKALEINPHDYKAHYGIGNALQDLGKIEDAIVSYEKARSLHPDLAEAYSNIIHLSQQVCAWEAVTQLTPRFDELVSRELAENRRVSETPLVNLSKEMNLDKNLAIAKSWAEHIEKTVVRLKKNYSFESRKQKQKITIGYLSNDLCNHPVAHLMLGVFSLHNRKEFEIFCYSYGPDDKSYHRQRIIQDCDKFVDIRHLSHADAAARIYEDGVDILVDLMGHTKSSRAGICALCPAPVQVTYLGYPGTTGASYFDYAVVDKIVVPEEHARFYSENLVYLPHCYQANDHRQIISDNVYTRADFGLRPDDFIFCSFNQNFKIEPVMFDSWMRILAQVPKSVLWLLRRSSAAEKNLKIEAQKRGIDPNRLVFADKLFKAEHLARHQLADLVLDTRIYTGHTTSSDALWAGVPVVTMLGQHFASRVSASILKAVGLPELITHSLSEFETLAVKLAKNPDLLANIRQKLIKYRLTEPLFDTPRFVRNLEYAYRQIRQMFVSGQKPHPIHVVDSVQPVKTMQVKPPSPTINIDAEIKRAFVLHQGGKLQEAEVIYSAILQINPAHADALHLSGLAAYQRDDHERAVTLIRQALRYSPNSPLYLGNLGAALQLLKRWDEAVSSYRRAVELKPDYAEGWLNLGGVLKLQGKYEDAISSYRKAVEVQPNYAEAYNSMALSYKHLGKFDDAAFCFQKAIAIKPDYVEALNNLGVTLQDQGKIEEAIASFQKAIAVKPDHLSALNNLGVVLQAQGRPAEAIVCYQKAVVIKPDSVEPYLNMGNAYRELNDIDNSVSSYEAALKIQPDYDKAYGSLFHQLQHACEWKKLEQMSPELDALSQKALDSGGVTAEVPFVSLTRHIDPARNFAVAKSWIDGIAGNVAQIKLNFSYEDRKHDRKIRIAYLSYDFRNHPVAHLMSGMFGLHNRNEFEIIAYGYGKADDSGYRKRIADGCDQFTDLNGLDHKDAAERVYNDRIDILVDLMGHTENKWLEIFALRPAPIQVTYLGYPGTTAASFMDYIITDRIVTPPEHARFYSEKFVYLPDCYQVTDGSLEIPHRPWKRKHFKLPSDAMVFSSFNHVYKIEPVMFDLWMSVMRQVPGSMLWLSKKNSRAEINLRKEAELRGVDAGRLIFADHLLNKDEHLTRCGLADLVLDTRVYNGHTTTADALWAGVPVITLRGGHFASRAASSILTAVGLPELIAHSLGDYERIVLRLAHHPEELVKIRQKLAKLRLTQPLFDTPKFVKNLEQAFKEMWGLFLKGEPPREITVQNAKCNVQKVPSGEAQWGGDYSQLGIKLRQEHRFDEAIAAFRKSLEINPNAFDVWGNMGNVYQAQRRTGDAIACYRKTVELKPDCVEAYNNLGNTLMYRMQYDEAIDCFKKALEFAPNLAEAYNNMGSAYKSQDKTEESLLCFRKAMKLKPELPAAYSNLSPNMRILCDWKNIDMPDAKLDEINRNMLENGLKAAETPFDNITRHAEPAQNLAIAASWAKEIAKPAAHTKTGFNFEARRSARDKIIIAYLSNDFFNHPVGHLTSSLFGLHNRREFRVFVYSYGPDDGSYYRKRIEQECDKFVDIRGMNYREAAQRIYDDGADILIDLMGHTKDNRLDICAFRPAPIQMTWLGYPGTSGADFFDYIIADKTIVPPEHIRYFSEKPIFMPHTYLIYDHSQPIADKNWKRADFGLPQDAFVICSFNQSYKIEPVMFDTWMRIMREIPESVLWLSIRYETAKQNLRGEAEKHGINSNRLIFAERMSLKEDYLARLKFADLALDTRLYNGHATTADALWAGVPVVTLEGAHFASRVASGLLKSVGLPELITHSLQAYQNLVLHLHRNPSELRRIRQKLAKNRLISPLFDTPRFVRNLESALKQIWQIFLSEERPRMIEVKDSAEIHPDISAELEKALNFHKMGQTDAAKQGYRKILETYPNHPDALHLLGVAYYQQGDFGQAIGLIQKAIDIIPNNPLYLGNLGAAFQSLNNVEQAMLCYRKASDIAPDHSEALLNMGLLLKSQGRLQEALSQYQKVLAQKPDFIDAHLNIGVLHKELGNTEQAISHFQEILQMNPKMAEAYYHLGTASENIGQAIEYYRKAISLKPDYPRAYNNLLSCLYRGCDWRQIRDAAAKTAEFNRHALENSKKPVEHPLDSLRRSDHPEYHFAIARTWSSEIEARLSGLKLAPRPLKSSGIITIGYFSTDFRNHPVGHLICPLFALHDRKKFKVICYSKGENDGSEYRQRIRQTCDQFTDLSGLSYAEAARRIYEDGVDILVNLTGYTEDEFPMAVCALRPAPIQISWLGFPGTTGAGFMDYIIADRIVLPDEQTKWFSEKIIYMPGTYMIADQHRIGNMAITRQSIGVGLPPKAFVFCSFNQPHKIEPKIFDCWARLLANMPGSVLWLSWKSEFAENNLKREIQARGISPDRLIFGKLTYLKEDHLARLDFADLALDTISYNGHVTTLDALWAGVPVIALLGSHFASRVAASLLTAVGLPELITHSIEQYESLALHLAKVPDKLQKIRQKLAKHRLTMPLFDTPKFVAALEDAYTLILNPETRAVDINAELTKGLNLQQTGQLQQAADTYRRVLALCPNHPDALHLLGIVAHYFGNDEEAANLIQKAIGQHPHNPIYYSNLGNALRQLGKPEEALSAYQKAVQLNPNVPEVYVNMGLIYHGMGKSGQAVSCYVKATDIRPEMIEAYNYLLTELKRMFAWEKIPAYGEKLDQLTQEALSRGIKTPETPFDNLRHQNPALNLAVAKSWSDELSRMMADIRPNFSFQQRSGKQGKIRLGYVSHDFRNHPVAYLMLGLFGRHHREKFEVFCYSYGPDDGGHCRKQIAETCDRFTDIRALSHPDAAKRIYDDGIDILIDLTGHTKNNRMAIFALRPAPVQVTYLGFPGTSGADFFDYIFTDKIVSPEEHQAFYSEKFAYLPDSYLIYDHRQPISEKIWTRAEAGLPETGLVFCSFNQAYKIEPVIFESWMKILAKIAGSVLWLSKQPEDAQNNLRQEAELRGVSGNRLIFAPGIASKADYLARLKLADLAMDTLIYNGHATTADALWAGVPVITIQGKHFASRVAASLLTAIGLPELITKNPDEYQARVLHFATHPDNLRKIRQKLAGQRLTMPLFDTPRFVRNMEMAYLSMWSCAAAGESPKQIEIKTEQKVQLDINAELAAAFQHHQAGRFDQAKAGYDRILQLNPNHPDALHLSGVMAHQHDDNDRAIAMIRRAIDISPQNALYYSNLGAILQRQGRTEEEIACYRKAIQANPDYPDAYCNLGLALKVRGKTEEAMSMFQKAAELNPNYADAYNGMGMLKHESDQTEEAVAYFQKAIRLNPNYADAYYNLANALAADHEQAIACYRKAIEIEPNHGRAFTNLFHRLLCACSWDRLGELFSKSESLLETWLKDGQRTPVQPLMSLIQHPNPAKNSAIAQSWARDVVNRVSEIRTNFSFQGRQHKKIRVGYLSNDFRNHPVAHLISGVFRLHNRNEFEIYCYSYGNDDGSSYRQKIRQDCDVFADLQHVGHAESAQRVYEDQIDILVDLMGFTKGGRLEICALRPAPIQVNYLGYPGTCGADFFDYIIVDKTIVPPEHAPYYTEKPVYMPHSYQANDNRQAFSDKPVSRKDFGIPDNRFVFCSFNQVHKIEPIMFAVWMSIMLRISESVLWLLPGNPLTEANLRREASVRGVDPARLVFTQRLDKPEHLSRHTLADLALDTRIYNGHTTTSDALWAGVPVIALLGTHFASRVSASLLRAVGLAGLVTQNLEEYEKLAVRLAMQPEELINIRQQLAKNRLSEPLFDTPRFTKDLEAAYKEMFRRWQNGEKPGVICGG